MVGYAEDDPELEDLVVRAANADEHAWRLLWAQIESRLDSWLRKRSFIARLSEREDDRRDVIVTVMARLREDDFRRLKLYLASRLEDPRLVFLRWLKVVTKRVAVDCLRAHPDYLNQRGAARPDADVGRWIVPEALPVEGRLLAGRPPITNRVAAKQILKYASGALTEDQRRAVELWSENGTDDEIAKTLQLADAAEADRLVRAALERLRRHFRKAIE